MVKFHLGWGRKSIFTCTFSSLQLLLLCVTDVAVTYVWLEIVTISLQGPCSKTCWPRIPVCVYKPWPDPVCFFVSIEIQYVQTYRQTYRHTDRQTDRQTDRHTYLPTYVHTYTHTYIHSDTYIHTYIHTYVYTYIHTYIHTYRTCIGILANDELFTLEINVEVGLTLDLFLGWAVRTLSLIDVVVVCHAHVTWLCFLPQDRPSRDTPLGFTITGGKESGFGIFVSKVKRQMSSKFIV